MENLSGAILETKTLVDTLAFKFHAKMNSLNDLRRSIPSQSNTWQTPAAYHGEACPVIRSPGGVPEPGGAVSCKTWLNSRQEPLFCARLIRTCPGRYTYGVSRSKRPSKWASPSVPYRFGSPRHLAVIFQVKACLSSIFAWLSPWPACLRVSRASICDDHAMPGPVSTNGVSSQSDPSPGQRRSAFHLWIS